MASLNNGAVAIKAIKAGAISDQKIKTPTWVKVVAAILGISITYLGIPAIVWLLLTAIIPAYSFGYWATVGLYVAWRLVRGPLLAARPKVGERA